MSEESTTISDSLFAQIEAYNDASKDGKGLPPVHLWNPEVCNEINMRIAKDGTWFYLGTPIKRERMVRLFSTVLKREDDGSFYLVTPVEQARIEVEDAPFLIVEMEVGVKGDKQEIVFRTNVGDLVVLGKENPLSLGDEKCGEDKLVPYVLVRNGLKAKINRSVYYQLADVAEEQELVDGMQLVVISGGEEFSIGAL